MKAPFYVDPNFPVIDGAGHSDKIAYFNVKGGGTTNTTCFDPVASSSHWFECYRTPVAVVSGTAPDDYSLCSVDPVINENAHSNPGCLNSISQGDLKSQRASDRVLLHRVVVNGTIRRPASESFLEFGALPVLPKVFVALVLDSDSNGSVFNAGDVFEPSESFFASNYKSCVPFLFPTWAHRYQVLAFDIVDFGDCLDAPYTWVDTPAEWNNTPPAPSIVTPNRYSFWRDVTRGFRFEVDLNDALCSFSSNSGTYTSLVDLGLHMVAILFDGVQDVGYTVASSDFNYCSISYQSRLFFSDFLSPCVAVPAGADEGPFPEEEADLVVLADQSAVMAGDAAVAMAFDRPQKRTKASHGFYNFRPRRGDAMLFDDDPERARLSYSQRGSKADSRSRVSDRNRRAVSYRRVSDEADDPVEPFQYEPRFRDDFDGAEPPRRRGKY